MKQQESDVSDRSQTVGFTNECCRWCQRMAVQALSFSSLFLPPSLSFYRKRARENHLDWNLKWFPFGLSFRFFPYCNGSSSISYASFLLILVRWCGNWSRRWDRQHDTYLRWLILVNIIIKHGDCPLSREKRQVESKLEDRRGGLLLLGTVCKYSVDYCQSIRRRRIRSERLAVAGWLRDVRENWRASDRQNCRQRRRVGA